MEKHIIWTSHFANRLEIHEESLEDFRKFKQKSNKHRKKVTDSAADNEKLLLVINEITKLKNQMYYLQQSIILLKNNGQLSFATGKSDEGGNTNGAEMSGRQSSPTAISRRHGAQSSSNPNDAENFSVSTAGDISSLIDILNERM